MSEVTFTGGINIADLKAKVDLEKQKAEKSKLKNIFWKPNQPETMVRIIPYKHGKTPFNELYFHYDINGETVMCPKHTFGKADCPICSYVAKLYASGLESDKMLAKKLRAKVRYYIPIVNKSEIERGGEARPYFWGAAPTVYESLIKYCLEEEDFGDIADPREGNDIRVMWEEKSAQNQFGKTTLFVKPKKTPMLKDMDVAMKLYDEVPNIMDLFKELSAAEIQTKLDKYLESMSTPVADIETDHNTVADNEGSESNKLKEHIASIITNQ